MSGAYRLFHDKHTHPLVNNVLIVFANKILCNLFIFCWHWLDTLLVAHTYIYEFSILYDKVKNALSIGIAHMYVNWLMFSRKEEERESKILA